jgi:hypothetical protein
MYGHPIHDSEDAGDLMGYVLHDIGSNPSAAGSPSPWNGQTRLEFDNTILSWQPGSHTVRHRIWFGADDPGNMVLAAEQNLGNEQYDPGDLMLNTTYYWRIDEVNDDSSVTSGNLWQFTTETEDVDPLLIYNDEQFGGTGIRVDIDTVYSGNQIPGGLDNQISSFRLAKGYMATVADGSDGTGPSKNYIAYNQDIEVPNLSIELDNAISFIRVLPWQAHVKKGTGGDLPEMNAGWYYNWSRGGTSTASREYVPMSWGKSGTDPDAILDYLDLDQVTHLLGFNESDDCNGQSGQYYNLCQQDVAVGYYENLMQTGLRLGSPGCREGGVFNWLPEFMDLAEAQDIRVDFIAVHWYDWASNPSVNTNPWPIEVFNRFINKLSDVYHYYQKPIWITEFNANIHRERSIQDTFLEFALPYLDRIGYVERYAYFQPSTGTGDFYDEQGQLTSTGLIYKNHESTPYYTPGILPSPWRSMDIGGYKAPGIALYGNGVYTVCSSGNDIGDTSDELYYVYQPITGDGEILVQVNSMLKTDDSAKAGLMIRQSLAVDSRYAMVAMTPKDGATFQYRAADGGETSHVAGGDCEPPYWIKLVRQGDAFTGYRSVDGMSWSMVGTSSVSMDETVYIGMCVCARNNHASFQDATLSNLRLSRLKSTIAAGDL